MEIMKYSNLYGLYFTKGFLSLMDEYLEDVYSNELKREDFLHLFYTLERGRAKTDNMIELPRDVRNNFGRTKINGVMDWKFVNMVDICEEKRMIYSTGYSNFKGRESCKAYGYTLDFSQKLLMRELEFQFCEISEKTYYQIYKNYSVPEDPLLLQHYNTICDLEMDISKASDFVKNYSGERLFRIVREICVIAYNDRIVVIEDPQTKRLYTSFNMMKKELREFCSYKGEGLSSLDLRSSQPYLLASILLKENPGNYEVQQFYKLVTEHDLYEWFIEKWGGFDYHTYEEARKFSKDLFFGYLYKSNKSTNSSQLVMQEYFPEIFNLIRSKKRTEELWLTLQKLEANIFIPVCNMFVDRGCLSVHDSLYFPLSLKEEVEYTLSKQFALYDLHNYKLK